MQALQVRHRAITQGVAHHRALEAPAGQRTLHTVTRAGQPVALLLSAWSSQTARFGVELSLDAGQEAQMWYSCICPRHLDTAPILQTEVQLYDSSRRWVFDVNVLDTTGSKGLPQDQRRRGRKPKPRHTAWQSALLELAAQHPSIAPMSPSCPAWGSRTHATSQMTESSRKMTKPSGGCGQIIASSKTITERPELASDVFAREIPTLHGELLREYMARLEATQQQQRRSRRKQTHGRDAIPDLGSILRPAGIWAIEHYFGPEDAATVLRAMKADISELHAIDAATYCAPEVLHSVDYDVYSDVLEAAGGDMELANERLKLLGVKKPLEYVYVDPAKLMGTDMAPHFLDHDAGIYLP